MPDPTLPRTAAPSADQVEAMDAVRAWWRDPSRQTFALAGYAGTGKTTVISRLLEDWKGRVVVGTPTGKAAQRLREKGVRAETIHRLAYRLSGHDDDGDPIFEYVGMASKKDQLVVVDEASMVNSDVYGDLVGSGYRILFVGDHGQLPPVGGDPGIMRRPDFTLREIHRQDDEGLLDFAHALRRGEHRPQAHGAVRVVCVPPAFLDRDQTWLQAVDEADVAICWRNATRHWLNFMLLRRRGLLPREAELDATPDGAAEYLATLYDGGGTFPVVCLRNNYKLSIFNGQVFTAQIVSLAGELLDLELLADDGRTRQVPATVDGFMAERGVVADPDRGLFDFGLCLTAHKSQGSEWPHVAVFDDTFASMDDRARWAYTAATRAKERLTWIHR